jgi:hypothetical protein
MVGNHTANPINKFINEILYILVNQLLGALIKILTNHEKQVARLSKDRSQQTNRHMVWGL